MKTLPVDLGGKAVRWLLGYFGSGNARDVRDPT